MSLIQSTTINKGIQEGDAEMYFFSTRSKPLKIADAVLYINPGLLLWAN